MFGCFINQHVKYKIFIQDVSVYPVAANAGQDEDDAGGNEDDAEDGWNNDWGTLEDVPQVRPP